MSTFLLPTYSLWTRDLKHFVRQRSRVIGAVGQPFVIWIFLAAGFRNSVSVDGMEYGAWLFPGVILLIALFAAIFSTISIIDDRTTGFLQGVLTSPASRTSILWSKMLAGTTIAVVQALLFMVLLPFSGITPTVAGFLLSLLFLTGIGMLFTMLGFVLAWRMSSTQGFHAVMTLLLIPLWMLSGAFFPVDGAADWMQLVVRLNPLYYVTALFQQLFFMGSSMAPVDVPAPWISLLVSGGLFLLFYLYSLRSLKA
ncbi:MAG: ABC transporter permease [Bacteroidetes bacterium]|nr:ABC transporter permease [Bacteroidota bacterium]